MAPVLQDAIFGILQAIPEVLLLKRADAMCEVQRGNTSESEENEDLYSGFDGALQSSLVWQ